MAAGIASRRALAARALPRMYLPEQRLFAFTEKPQLGEGWINGAFFVLEPGVQDYICDDDTQWGTNDQRRTTPLRDRRQYLSTTRS